MNTIPIFTCLNTLIIYIVNGMLVNSWGTSSQPNRLAYSVRDLLEESFKIATAVQQGVYPIDDFRQNYTQKWNGISSQVIFQAYNGWIQDLTLNTSELNDLGKLRRLILTGAERSMALKNPNLTSHQDITHQHEEILCDSCAMLNIKSIHYGYEAVFYNYETAGTLSNDENIPITISFHLTIESSHNTTINKDYCFSQIEPILMLPKLNNKQSLKDLFKIKMKNINIFNFLADYTNEWISMHFNTTVLPSIRDRFETSMRKILRIHNPCERFLVA